MQIILVLVAVVSVPWMLLFRPFILRSRYRKRQLAKGNTRQHRPLVDDEHPIIGDTDAPVVDGDDDDEEVFDFGEVW